jgi:hypothetical protein
MERPVFVECAEALVVRTAAIAQAALERLEVGRDCD